MLVEDDAILNKTLTYNLISEGCDMESVLNAGAAAEALVGTEYDMVLLDINLHLLLVACTRESKAKGKKGLMVLSSKKKKGFLSDSKYMGY